MSDINRRGLFGVAGGLAAILGLGRHTEVAPPFPFEPQPPDVAPGGFGKLQVDPSWHLRRIAELKKRLANLNVRYEVSSTFYIETLKSVSPIVKRLYHAEHRRREQMVRARNSILLELSQMGPNGLATLIQLGVDPNEFQIDPSGSDYNSPAATTDETASPY